MFKERYKNVDPKHTATILALLLVVGYLIIIFPSNNYTDKEFVAETEYLLEDIIDDVESGINFSSLKFYIKANEYIDKYDSRNFASAEYELYEKMKDMIYYYQKMVDYNFEYGENSKLYEVDFHNAKAKVKRMM